MRHLKNLAYKPFMFQEALPRFKPKRSKKPKTIAVETAKKRVNGHRSPKYAEIDHTPIAVKAPKRAFVDTKEGKPSEYAVAIAKSRPDLALGMFLKGEQK